MRLFVLLFFTFICMLVLEPTFPSREKEKWSLVKIYVFCGAIKAQYVLTNLIKIHSYTLSSPQSVIQRL